MVLRVFTLALQGGDRERRRSPATDRLGERPERLPSSASGSDLSALASDLPDAVCELAPLGVVHAPRTSLDRPTGDDAVLAAVTGALAEAPHHRSEPFERIVMSVPVCRLLAAALRRELDAARSRGSSSSRPGRQVSAEIEV